MAPGPVISPCARCNGTEMVLKLLEERSARGEFWVGEDRRVNFSYDRGDVSVVVRDAVMECAGCGWSREIDVELLDSSLD